MPRHCESPVSISAVNLGADLTPEQVEFGKAMERFKRERRRPFPTCSEVLEVLKSLGYRKVDQPKEDGDARAQSQAR